MNLCIYSSQQEENIFIRKQARTWQRSDLITTEQLTAIDKLTALNLRQTNIFFRFIFFIFTCLCAGTLLGFLIWITGIRKPVPIALILLTGGTAFYWLAQYAVSKYCFYRHGIEEALALIAMAFFCLGCGILLDELILTNRQAIIGASALCAICAFWIYQRFGFLYAAMISIIALCIIPFQLSLAPLAGKIFLLIILCLILFLSIIFDNDEKEDFRKEKNTIIQACVLAGIYLTVNLEILGALGVLTGATGSMHLRPKAFPPYIYWTSYVLTFIIPVAGIYVGIKSRKRLILNLSLVMACVTMATNKSYLGMTRYAWDPAILGTALVIISIAINIWLNRGENKHRKGFTAENILKPESHGISLTEVAAALTPVATGLDMQQPASEKGQYFDGGASGGGGASRNF